MEILISIVSPFFCLILIGYIFGKSFKYKNDGLYWLNNFIIYIAVPALLFSLLSRANIEEVLNIKFILLTLGLTFSIYLISFLTMIVVRKQTIGNACLLATSSSFGNVGYMGVPLMIALLGDKAIIPATLILVFDNLIHILIVPLVAGRNDGGSILAKIGYGFLELGKSPFLIATLLGLFISWLNISLPDLIMNLSDQLGQAAIPTALFSLGLSLSFAKMTLVDFNKSFLIFMKLIVHPILVALVFIYLTDFDPIWSATAIIMSSLPTALTVYMLAMQYDKDGDTISSITLFGTILSVVTISAIIYWVDLYLLKLS